MRPALALPIVYLVVAAAAGPANGQGTRKATTVPALGLYPVFFHGQQVALRAQVQGEARDTWLVDGEARVRVLGRTGAVSGAGPEDGSTLYEVRGVFWDVGRLEAGDPRLRPHDFAAMAQESSGRDWPAPGEILVVIADAVEPAAPPPAPSIRALALDPGRYAGQRITVTGRFRGRNLYGDLPQAPGRSRWDFVLQSADAAVWVTGMQPRGRDFNLNIDARVDTGRWLEVSGTVDRGGGLVWIEAKEIRRASEPADTQAEAVPAPPPPPPPAPEVIFSTPLVGEVDVPSTLPMARVQFSRDMDPRSFRNQVRAAYAGPPAVVGPAEPQASIEFSTEYVEGNRVLEIRFTNPLDPFRAVRIELLDGIRSSEGQALTPWTLTFTVGS
jgi:hypothetical protein